MDTEAQKLALVLLGWGKPPPTRDGCEFVSPKGECCWVRAILMAPKFTGSSRVIEQVCEKHLQYAGGARAVPKSLHGEFTEWPDD